MNNLIALNILAYLHDNKINLNELSDNVINKLDNLKETNSFNDKNKLIAGLVCIQENNIEQFRHINNLLEDGVSFIEEELIVNDFLSIFEDVGAVPTNVTGANISADQPVIKKRYTSFDVPKEVFHNIDGRSPFRNIVNKLSLENYDEKMLYNFHRNNPNSHLILKSNNSLKILRP